MKKIYNQSIQIDTPSPTGRFARMVRWLLHPIVDVCMTETDLTQVDSHVILDFESELQILKLISSFDLQLLAKAAVSGFYLPVLFSLISCQRKHDRTT